MLHHFTNSFKECQKAQKYVRTFHMGLGTT